MQLGIEFVVSVEIQYHYLQAEPVGNLSLCLGLALIFSHFYSLHPCIKLVQFSLTTDLKNFSGVSY